MCTVHCVTMPVVQSLLLTSAVRLTYLQTHHQTHFAYMSLLQPCSSLVPALFLILVYLFFISHEAQSGLFCPHAKEDNLVAIEENCLQDSAKHLVRMDGGREKCYIYNYTYLSQA